MTSLGSKFPFTLFVTILSYQAATDAKPAQPLSNHRQLRVDIPKVVDGVLHVGNTNRVVSLNKKISRLEDSLPGLVSSELDQHGLLIKISIVLSLITLILGAASVVGGFMCGCLESVRRRQRINDWQNSAKGMEPRKKYTQSFGEPDTDAETTVKS